MEKLTTRQNEVLDYVKSYVATNGYPPAIREIGKALGLNSPATIHSHLTSLESKGYIKKTNSRYRSLELLVGNEYIKDDIVEVPLLGKITAGTPIEAIETPNEFFALPAYLIPKKEEVFTLKVSGESMINAGVFDGDIVIVQRQNVAKNGDMVVAMTEENEVTLKTFYKETNCIRLQPENDTMKPIILKNCSILGKAIGLYRKF
ncbi:MAG: transcriptional repressor LexA [Bacilli bacterium]